LANHRSLKNTSVHAEPRKNSEKQAFTIVIPKKQQKKFQSKTFSQHEKTRFKHTRIYTQVQRGKPKEPQRTLSPYDPKEHYHHTTPKNRNSAMRFGTALIM
jgi:hypothetical protein